MAKETAKNEDGSVIDPSKDLQKFIEKVAPPQSGESVETPAVPAYKTVTFDDVEDEELKGKTGEQAVQILAMRRREAQESQQREQQLRRELEQERQQRQMEDIARRTVTQALPAQPTAPQIEDPRIAEINDKWITEPDRARFLMDQMADERAARNNKKGYDDLKAEIESNLEKKRINEDAQNAYGQLRSHLVANGVDGNLVDSRSRALLAEVTYHGSPFFPNGSLRNARNLLAAWNHLFGEVKAAPPAPAATAQLSTPTPPTPPGSGRPAPAAAPGSPPKGTLSPEQRRAREYIAPRLGLSADDLIERGKRRNANAN